jgi:hypothetical protein
MYTTNIHNVENLEVSVTPSTLDSKEGWISLRVYSKSKWTEETALFEFTLFCNDIQNSLAQLEAGTVDMFATLATSKEAAANG